MGHRHHHSTQKENGSQRQPGTKDKVTNAIHTDEKKRKSVAMKEKQGRIQTHGSR